MFDFDNKKKKKIFTYKSFFTVALPCFISVTIAAAVVVIYLFCVANALVSFSFFLIIFLFDINILKKKQGKENFLLVFIRYIFFLPFFSNIIHVDYHHHHGCTHHCRINL